MRPSRYGFQYAFADAFDEFILSASRLAGGLMAVKVLSELGEERVFAFQLIACFEIGDEPERPRELAQSQG